VITQAAARARHGAPSTRPFTSRPYIESGVSWNFARVACAEPVKRHRVASPRARDRYRKSRYRIGDIRGSDDWRKRQGRAAPVHAAPRGLRQP